MDALTLLNPWLVHLSRRLNLHAMKKCLEGAYFVSEAHTIAWIVLLLQLCLTSVLLMGANLFPFVVSYYGNDFQLALYN